MYGCRRSTAAPPQQQQQQVYVSASLRDLPLLSDVPLERLTLAMANLKDVNRINGVQKKAYAQPSLALSRPLSSSLVPPRPLSSYLILSVLSHPISSYPCSTCLMLWHPMPSYPISSYTVSSHFRYWSAVSQKVDAWARLVVPFSYAPRPMS